MSILESKEWALIKQIVTPPQDICSGVEYCIAGGYARDTFYGKEPKDMDVGVFNADSTEILDILRLLDSNDLIAKSYIDEEELMVAYYQGNHIAGVVTCKGGIDLIFCNEEVSNAKEWINTFDYNLNQFAILDKRGPLFLGENYGTLTFNNTNTNRLKKAVERREKMLKLAGEFGWEISDYVRDMGVEEEILKFRSESNT